jgi:hypothetical protein
VRGTLFDPAFGGLSGHYPTGQGLHCLKYVGALERGLAYLSRCNSGWFYHIILPPGNVGGEFVRKVLVAGLLSKLDAGATYNRWIFGGGLCQCFTGCPSRDMPKVVSFR